MMKYIKELFSSKEQQYVRSAEEELRTYKSDRVRLMRSLAMTNAAVIANEASIKALEECLPAMRAQMLPKGSVKATGALAQVMEANNAKAQAVQLAEPKAAFPFDAPNGSSYK